MTLRDEVINIRQSYAPQGAKHFSSRTVTLPKLFPLLSIFCPSPPALFSVTAHNLSLPGGGVQGTHSRGLGSTAYLLHTRARARAHTHTHVAIPWFSSPSPCTYIAHLLSSQHYRISLDTLLSYCLWIYTRFRKSKCFFSAKWVKFTLLEENTESF